ncbi:hypothetical protein LTR66_009245 [Elasticomyces elasticus]|nr:hypothetical protein LTR28_010272 [Elasticomyces elasticus]KAK4982488.1 hypothetical protein LTR66_009245 [Elasticomyces elasticus]
MQEVKTADVKVKASPTSGTVEAMAEDECHLATLGYIQVFMRNFNMFENWAATFTTMILDTLYIAFRRSSVHSHIRQPSVFFVDTEKLGKQSRGKHSCWVPSSGGVQTGERTALSLVF